MSLNKVGFKSLNEKEADWHMETWREILDEATGKSGRELGIYNEKEINEKMLALFRESTERPELKFIEELKRIFPQANVYLVGGSVRDAVLGKEAKDIDLIINRIDPVELIDVLNKFGNVTFDRNPKADLKKMSRIEREKLIYESYGVIKFHPKNSKLSEPIDIAFPREDDYSKSGESGIRGIKRDTDLKPDPNLSINNDLARRDLTINAMAINLTAGEIVDPFGGIEDLVRGKIRTVGDPRERILDEDFSRGFRALRFACVFNADLYSETKKAIKEIFLPSEKSAEELYGDNPEVLAEVKKLENQIKREFEVKTEKMPKCLQIFWDAEQKKPRLAVAKEVMNKEILKAIGANPKKFITLLDEVGGLPVLFPELAALKGVEQPREHHREGDVYKHTLLLLDKLPKSAGLRLKLAALFHDIGKPATKGVNSKGTISFYGHDEAGKELFSKIAQRFRLNKKLKDEVKWLIENHMFPLSDNVKEIKSVKIESKFLGDIFLTNDLILLSEADAAASLSESREDNFKNINIFIEKINGLKKKLSLSKTVRVTTPPLITGENLIKIGLRPGPAFKKILEEMRDAQLRGVIKTPQEGEELIKRMAQSQQI